MINRTARFFKQAAFPLRILLAAVLICALFFFVDPQSILREIRNVSLLPYLAVVMGHFALMSIKALRWKYLMQEWSITCTYRDCLRGYIASFAVGTFTPGQLGDVSKIMLVRGAAGNRLAAAVPWATDRLWDFFGLVLAGIACAIYIFAAREGFTRILVYGMILLIVGFLGLLLLWYLLRRFVLRNPQARIKMMFLGWTKGLPLTALAILIQFLRWGILAWGMGLPVIQATASAIIGTLVALIPISVGGLGTREGSIAAMFSYMGLDPSLGVAFSLLMFGAYLVGAIVGIAVLLSYRRRYSS